jgi:hypothetical protein
MILTEQFVLLNFPRTGSTFARAAVKKLYERRNGPSPRQAPSARPGNPTAIRELLLPIDRTISAFRTKRHSQHGSFGQIPPTDQGKPVVSVIRNPFDLIVSHFEHGFWKENPIADEKALRARFGSYPDLDFDEYLAMAEEFGLPDVLKGRRIDADVGPQTIHFIRFFFRDPDAVLDRLTDEYIDRREFVGELPEIRFLHTENLRRELRDFLVSVGFLPEETEFIESLPRKNVAASRRNRPWAEYYDDERMRAIRRKERMLFLLFPEYDVDPRANGNDGPAAPPCGERR